MGMVSGFLNTSSIGKAVGSIGDDWSQYARQSARDDTLEKLAMMREERERGLVELKAELAAMRAGGGLGGAGARGSKNGGWAGSGVGGQLSEDEEAALGGHTLPEHQAGKRFQTGGPQSEQKATVDSPGMEYLDPADRAQLQGAGGMKGETPDSIAGRKAAPKYREGVVGRIFGPGNYKEGQEGATERRKREVTLDAPTIEDSREGGERVANAGGKGGYHVGERTVGNQFTGENESTEFGEAEIKKDEAKAGRDAKSGDPSTKVHSVTPGGDGKLYIVYENGRREPLTDKEGKHVNSKDYNETRRRIESEIGKNPTFMGQRNAEKRVAEVERQMAEIYGGSVPKQAPKPGTGTPPINDKSKPGSSAAASTAPYPDGTRLKGKDGKSYVVKNGKPVPI